MFIIPTALSPKYTLRAPFETRLSLMLGTQTLPWTAERAKIASGKMYRLEGTQFPIVPIPLGPSRLGLFAAVNMQVASEFRVAITGQTGLAQWKFDTGLKPTSFSGTVAVAPADQLLIGDGPQNNVYPWVVSGPIAITGNPTGPGGGDRAPEPIVTIGGDIFTVSGERFFAAKSLLAKGSTYHIDHNEPCLIQLGQLDIEALFGLNNAGFECSYRYYSNVVQWEGSIGDPTVALPTYRMIMPARQIDAGIQYVNQNRRCYEVSPDGRSCRRTDHNNGSYNTKTYIFGPSGWSEVDASTGIA